MEDYKKKKKIGSGIISLGYLIGQKSLYMRGFGVRYNRTRSLVNRCFKYHHWINNFTFCRSGQWPKPSRLCTRRRVSNFRDLRTNTKCLWILDELFSNIKHNTDSVSDLVSFGTETRKLYCSSQTSSSSAAQIALWGLVW